MQLAFIALTFLLLAVGLFALQNAQPVTVRFLHLERESSLAVVTLAATATGAIMAGLLGLAARLRRWSRGRAVARAARSDALAPPAARPSGDLPPSSR